jgi:hypothetical protein
MQLSIWLAKARIACPWTRGKTPRLVPTNDFVSNGGSELREILNSFEV